MLIYQFINMDNTFIISNKNNQECITCLICNMTSYNPNDIKFEYCGNCNQFHNVLKLQKNEQHKNLDFPRSSTRTK